MEQQVDVTAFTLSNHESVRTPTAQTTTLELYRDSVVQPSLDVLDAKIEEFRTSDDAGAWFAVDMYAELSQSTIEGYLLTVQSMWERGVRDMLTSRAQAQGKDGAFIKRLQHSTWSPTGLDGLQQHFTDLMGLPLQAFDTYADMELLQVFGSAFRHGDGKSAQRLYQLCPNLWLGWLAPGESFQGGPFTVTAALDGPRHPSIKDITLKDKVLHQLLQSVLWFWEDIEMIRCNSFSAKATSVERKLERWKAERGLRMSKRVWTPDEQLFNV